MIETGRKRKSTKKKTKKKGSVKYKGGLELLIEFLNFDFSTVKKIEGYVDAFGHKISYRLSVVIYSDLSLNRMDILKGLQNEIIEVLSPIAEPPAGFTRIEMQDHLTLLINRIQQLKFETRLVLLPAEQNIYGAAPGRWIVKYAARQLLTPDQRIFSRNGGRWIVKLEFSFGSGYAPKKDFYAAIADGLINGELAMLRRCTHCRKFFVATQRRQTFCVPEHARLYYDDPKRAKARVDKSRGKS